MQAQRRGYGRLAPIERQEGDRPGEPQSSSEMDGVERAHPMLAAKLGGEREAGSVQGDGDEAVPILDESTL